MKEYYQTPFNTATTAPVEGYFADIKNELRNSQSIMSVDRFVVSHLNSIEGTLKLAKSSRIINKSIDNVATNLDENKTEIKCTKNYNIHIKNESDFAYNNDQKNDFCEENKNEGINGNKFYAKNNILNDDYDEMKDLNNIKIKKYIENNDESDDSEIDENIKTTENWKNKGETPLKDTVKKIKKRSTKYVDGCTEIRRFLNTSGLRSTNKTIILNGNLLPAVKIRKNSILVSNTCAFDALLVAMTVAYADFPLFKEYLDTVADKNTFLNLCKEVAFHGANTSTYKVRAEILMNSGICEQNLVHAGTSILNCRANVAGLSYKLLSDIPSSIETKICKNCNNEIQFSNTTVIIESIRHGNNLTQLNNILNEYTEDQLKFCKVCNEKTAMASKKLSCHILIETDIGCNNEENVYRLEDIPKQLFVQNIR